MVNLINDTGMLVFLRDRPKGLLAASHSSLLLINNSVPSKSFDCSTVWIKAIALNQTDQKTTHAQ